MMLGALTVSDLLLNANPKLRRAARRLLADDMPYEFFIETLSLDVLECVGRLEENPDEYKDDDEDKLTSHIIGNLQSMGYLATHDTKIGGHGDIVVRTLSDYLWIGEAKIHTSYDKLFQGFNQLTTRYLPGTMHKNCGAVIIYVRSSKCAKVVSEWKDALRGEGIPDTAFGPCALRDDLGFNTSVEHEGSAMRLSIWHLGVKLFWGPRDDAPKLASRKRRSKPTAPANDTAGL